MDRAALPHHLDAASLTGPVRSVLGCATAQVGAWDVTLLHGGYSGAGVYRIAGDAQTHDRAAPLPWALVLKVVGPPRPDAGIPEVSQYLPPAETLSPQGTEYWKRDAMVYQSGLLADLPPSISAPRCFGTVEQDDGTVWLWLENLTDLSGTPWSLPDGARAAYHLGCFNGAYLTGRPLPALPWLCPGGLRPWMNRAIPGLEQLPTVLDHPIVQRLCPPALVPRLLRLWHARAPLLDALDQLPQTFGHHDVGPLNAVLRRTAESEEQLVAIDWGMAGIGAVGHDPGHLVSALLVGALLSKMALDPAQTEALDAHVFTSYLAGLRAVGWQGDAAVVRLGYTAALALRGIFSNLPLFLAAALRQDHHAYWEQQFGAPLEEVCAMVSQPYPFFLDRAEEAQALAAR